MSTLSMKIINECHEVLDDGGEIHAPMCCQSWIRLAHRSAIEVEYLESEIERLKRTYDTNVRAN